ncbi:MAG: MFS transporter [Actinobacteria bacterium]|nr:MFS transporter [Actinomycetota bacterium]
MTTTSSGEDVFDEITGRHLPVLEPVTPDALPPKPPRRRRNPLVRVVRRFRDDIRGLLRLRETPYGMGPALIIGMAAFFQQFDTRAFYYAAPEITRAIGAKVSTIINVQVVIGTFIVFVTIFIGWWADRHRRVPLFAVGTIISGLGAMGMSRATSTISLGIPRVVDDVSFAASDVPEYSLLADYYPPEARGRTFAFLGTLNRVASLVSVLGVGLMLRQWGFRTTFVVIGIPIVLIGIIAAIRLREPVRGYFDRKAAGVSDDVARVEDEAQSFGEGWRTTFAVRTLRRTFAADLILEFGDLPVALFLPFYLSDRYGLDALQRGYILIPAVIVGLYAGVLGGGLIDRFSGRNPGQVLTVFGIFRLVTAFGVLLYAFHPPIAVIIAASCISAFGSGLIGPARSAIYAQVIPPSIRTQGLQIINIAVVPAAVIGVQLSSVIFRNYGYQSVFAFAVPFFVIGAFVIMSAGAFFDVDRRNAAAQSIAAEEWRKAKEAGNDKLLVCRDVDVAYDGVQVLFGVDFDVTEGEIIALLGTNGAGKSTLLKAISGTQEASAGGIVFNGRDVTHMPPHEVAARGVVHMPGGRGVFPGLSVRENLLLGNWLQDDPEGVKTRVQEVFEIFPVLRERADASAGDLSGGEQQMLSLAQAFLMQPKLLLIDELSLGLSPAMVGQLLEVVREIHRRGVTIVVVEQSVNVALNLAERAIFMEKGEVKFFGRTSDLLARPDILRAVYVKGTGALTDGAPAGAMRGERERRKLELGDSRNVLEVEHIVKRYGGITAVDDVTFELRDGEVLGVIGPNGSGKTTLFDVISGFQPADGGRVTLAGVDVTGSSPEARVSAGLVRRFQDARLFPSLTVTETLLIALEQRLEVRSTLLNAISAPQARRAERRLRARAERLVELLSLDAYQDKFVKELSTGLRRIVDLACVLAAEPKVLLLDEPSSGIAQAEAEGLAPLLRRVRFETGCSILIIEHDMPLISQVADELIALDQGAVVVRGTPEAVLNDDRVIEAYLGGSEAAVKRSGRLT